MNIHLLECRDNAKLLNAGENCPRRNGRKVGYMELMRDMFLEKFPELNSLTAQNLRDQISQAEKDKHCLQTPLEETYRSDIDSLQQIPLVEEVSQSVNEENSPNTNDVFDTPLSELECKACNRAREILDVINREDRSME